MNEIDIKLMVGKLLVRAFQKAVYPNAIGENSGPLVAVDDDGEIVVFLDEESTKPEILVMNSAEQMVGAMYFLQTLKAKFETTEDREKVCCTIGNVQSLGRDYFEAGMRAYLLFKSRNKEFKSM
ncbi:hypothetical protein GTP46_11275 [Duganella sp. FT135W]|uniref:Uncharacterized protein n=1 Tax=Duganella flavida TaxID=2692175 RepID=A0A6L8K9D1_9BURK|nr:hypothetical protein [Duganella flavida]MYM23227.1 hypothetical protein [Duganella flavida]